jgi:hypothetical protein
MDLAAFTHSTRDSAPPPGLSPPLVALWHAARGEWAQAHLQRGEGDLANAGYWYRRAGKAMPTGNLAAEREAIAAALLADG